MAIDPNVLQPASVIIPLTAGLDLKHDVEALDPPALQRLENAQFFAPGGIGKDFGYEIVNSGVFSGNTMVAPIRRFIDANTGQLVASKNNILERSATGDRFKTITGVSSGLNVIASAGCDQIDDVFRQGSQVFVFDYASLATFELIIIRDVANVVKITIRDPATGSVVYSVISTGSTGGGVKAITVGTRLLAFWINGTNIQGLTWDTATPTVLPVTNSNLISAFNTGNALDVVGGASVVYMACQSAANPVMARFLASTLAFQGSINGAAAVVTGPMGICLDASENSLIIWRDAGGVKMFGATSAGALRSTSTVDAAATTATQVGCVSNENATSRGTAFYVNNSGNCVRAQVAFDGSGGTLNSATLFNVTLAHRPFTIGDAIFVGYFYTRINANSTERVLVTVMHDTASTLVTASDPVCWYLYGQATSNVHPSCAQISPIAGPGPTLLEYKWAAVISDLITVADLDQSVVVAKFRPWEGQALAAPNRSTTYVCDSFINSTLGLLSASFGYAPSIISIAFNNSTGSLVAGQAYTWQAVYETLLPDGTMVRSASSIPVTAVVTAGNNTATLTITSYFARFAAGNTTQTRVFRTQAGPGIGKNILNGVDGTSRRTADTFTFNDGAPDSLIAANRLIYTSGGVLDAFPAPMARVVTLHQNRFFAIEEFSKELRFTREIIDGEAPAWNPNLAIDIFGQGIDPRALITSTNGLWILGRNRQTGGGAIALLVGQGPDDTGVGSSFTIQRLETADLGPTDWRQAISTPEGILFEDPWQGFHLLPPGGGTPLFIGASVESLRTPSAAGASLAMTLQLKRKEVRIAQSDRLLVWHYDVNTWSQRFIGGGLLPIDLCVWNGDSTVAIANSTTFQKQVTSPVPGFTDNGGTFYALRWKTAPIKTAGFAGFSRIWDIQLHGHATSRHGVIVNLYFDDNPTPQVFTFSAADIDVKLASTDKYVLRLKPRVQKCTSFVVEVLDTDAGNGTRQGPIWNAVRVNYGAFRRPSKVRANLQKG